MTDYLWHERRPPVRDLPHVTRDEGERVVRFGAHILDMLRMGHWRVDLDESPADEESIAEMNIVEGRHVATISLSSDWMSREDEERLNCVIHEMMHVVHWRLTHHMYGQLEKSGMVPDATRDIMWESTRIEAEMMCDHLAGAFSQWDQIRESWVTLKKIIAKERKAEKKKKD